MACWDKCALIFTKTTRLADSGTKIELPTKKNSFSDAWVNLPLMLVGNFASGSDFNKFNPLWFDRLTTTGLNQQAFVFIPQRVLSLSKDKISK